MEEKKIKTYKGFNADMTCRGFHYEVGKEYELPEGHVELCASGFHACENPFEVLSHYSGLDCHYCEVEQEGDIKSDGDKTASSRIRIKADIGFIGLFKAGIEYLKEITKYNDNDCNGSGDYAQIGSSGYCAKIKSEGNDAVIMCTGAGSMARAKVGSWITLAEWIDWKPVCQDRTSRWCAD